MTTRGDVRIDIDTHEEGTSAATSALDSLNAKLDEFASMKLDATLNLLSRAKDMIIGLGEVAEDLEQRLNISRSFENIKDAALKLNEARLATRGLFSDTELRKRIISMERLNLTMMDQVSLLESMTKIQTTSGEDAKAIFDKLIDTYAGSKDALKEFGIVVTDSSKALDQVAASLSNVRMEDFSVSVQQAMGSMDALKDTAVAAWEAFRGSGIKSVGPWREATHGVEMTDEAMTKLAESSRTYDEFLSKLNANSRTYARNTWSIVEALKVQRAEMLKLAAAGAFRAAPASATESSIEQGLTSAAEAQLEIDANKKKGKRRRRGGGRRRRAEVFDLDAALAMQAAVSAAEDIDLDPLLEIFQTQGAEMERTVELQQLQLDMQLQMTEGMDQQTVHQVDHALAIERQIVALQQRHEIEQASLEFAQDMIDAEEMRHRKALANKKAEMQFVGLEMRAGKQKRTIQQRESQRQKQEFDTQLNYWGSVGKAVGETAALLASNEQERAGIMAAMAVLDASMAAIRIVSDMGISGLPLAAATMALGVATAAGYAAQSGSGSRPPSPGGFGAGFQATAIQERPDAAGAPIVYNINAGLVVGGTPQQAAGILKGVTGDSGGMREGAA
jgi:hypothetical protein